VELGETERADDMKTNAYRWFPHGLIVAMVFAFLINATMVYLAVQGFPGVAGTDGFNLSRDYDTVMASSAKQATLGWQVEASLDDARYPVFRLTDRAGAPLPGARLDAHAERPLGPPESTVLAFHALDPAHYQADTALAPGQWDVLATVTSGESRYTTTRRLIVK
jgi:nitrogen fixation protein FixH